MRPRKPCHGYTGHWSEARFRDMLRASGIDPDEYGAATKIAKRITEHRRERDPEADAVDTRTVRRWLSEGNSPARGPGGKDPYIWEICRVFDVDPAWLMTGEAQP
jgi:hypothetical protein